VRLEALTVGWNVVECVVGIVSGVVAGSVALIGFGFDALIETTSAIVVLWRLRVELTSAPAADFAGVERRAARTSGALLVLLAATIVVESFRRLLGAGARPEESAAGMALTAVSAAAMPLLGWSKLRLARRLDSGALRIEAEQTIACAWFSLTTLAGLALNARLGWWWADPLAALALVPWMLREGIEPWRPARMA